jgi:triacylglycerol esterase/lipase EstA (alpha/beta hydrolase family)
MMPRYYLKNLGGGAKVNALVALSPSNHGTSLNGLVLLAEHIGFVGGLAEAICPACTQQIRGSTFMTALDAGGDTVPGVKYTVIASQYDGIVTPYTNGYLSGANVTNINVQHGCFLDFVEHIAIPYDRRALAHVLNALDPAHPRWIPCVPVAAFIGG